MIKPLHDNVVLKKEKVENKTSSGIILTTESKSMPSVATVVAIGKDCKAEIKENDQVVYKEYSGTNIKIDEVEYIKYRKATEKFLNKMLERVLD